MTQTDSNTIVGLLVLIFFLSLAGFGVTYHMLEQMARAIESLKPDTSTPRRGGD